MNDQSEIWENVINGERRRGASGVLQEYDPSTGQAGYLIARSGPQDIAEAVASAKAAQPAWADLRPIRRGRVLTAIGQGLRADPEYFAKIDQGETGRRLALCLGEVELAALLIATEN